MCQEAGSHASGWQHGVPGLLGQAGSVALCSLPGQPPQACAAAATGAPSPVLPSHPVSSSQPPADRKLEGRSGPPHRAHSPCPHSSTWPPCAHGCTAAKRRRKVWGDLCCNEIPPRQHSLTSQPHCFQAPAPLPQQPFCWGHPDTQVPHQPVSLLHLLTTNIRLVCAERD